MELQYREAKLNCEIYVIQKIVIVPRHSNVPIKLKHTSFALHFGGDSAHSLISKEIKTTKITCHKILSTLISALLVSKVYLAFYSENQKFVEF